jgi:hypothetical protein
MSKAFSDADLVDVRMKDEWFFRRIKQGKENAR